jgi:hypothetical protein
LPLLLGSVDNLNPGVLPVSSAGINWYNARPFSNRGHPVSLSGH